MASDSLPKTILVGLAENQQKVSIDSDGVLVIHSLISSSVFRTREAEFDWLNGVLMCNGKDLSNEVIIEPETKQTLLRFNGNVYRGIFRIQNKSLKKIQVVNEVGLDDYLAGVLPLEVSTAWPAETLKAQAIVSRTFVSSNLNRHKTEGYDVCAQTHCQVYRGVKYENVSTNRAILETRGMVLTYGGNLIQSYFHADCGGRTEAAVDVWQNGSRFPYLRSVRCKGGRNPRSAWKITISKTDLAQAL